MLTSDTDTQARVCATHSLTHSLWIAWECPLEADLVSTTMDAKIIDSALLCSALAVPHTTLE